MSQQQQQVAAGAAAAIASNFQMQAAAQQQQRYGGPGAGGGGMGPSGQQQAIGGCGGNGWVAGGSTAAGGGAEAACRLQRRASDAVVWAINSPNAQITSASAVARRVMSPRIVLWSRTRRLRLPTSPARRWSRRRRRVRRRQPPRQEVEEAEVQEVLRPRSSAPAQGPSVLTGGCRGVGCGRFDCGGPDLGCSYGC